PRTAPDTSCPRYTSGCERRSSAASDVLPERHERFAHEAELFGHIGPPWHHGNRRVESRVGQTPEGGTAVFGGAGDGQRVHHGISHEVDGEHAFPERVDERLRLLRTVARVTQA